MFNNCDSKTNGEYLFLTKIAPHINTIFDVGCRKDSDFTRFNGVVHYFDPVEEFINDLKTQENTNARSYFNVFGLGNKDEEIDYFPKYQSFFNRTASCGVSDEASKRKLKIRRAADYIQENDVQSIDFLKIDTEGFEFEVLKGFDTYLEGVKYIQFEYGGTFMDNGVKLKDVVDYLSDRGFVEFSYLTGIGMHPITDFTDHYQYCNIVCCNSRK